jgi:hypothetical protein
MRKNNFALRLRPSLIEEARRAAKAEGVTMNQLINVAVAEKVSALRPLGQISDQPVSRIKPARYAEAWRFEKSLPNEPKKRV